MTDVERLAEFVVKASYDGLSPQAGTKPARARAVVERQITHLRRIVDDHWTLPALHRASLTSRRNAPIAAT